MAQRLTERFAFSVEPGGSVDRSGKYPLIKNVLLCGPVSANRRRYKPGAFAGERVKRYEGRPVFIDHGDGRKGRGYRDQVGWVESARLRADGMPVGDIAIKPTHADAGNILFDAEHRPANCGMSHVAQCETVRGADGWDEVTDVVEVESVDIVVDPATTSGLKLEQRGRPMKVKEYLQKLAPKLLVNQLLVANKVLKEFGEPDMTADAPAPDAADTAGGDGVTAAVKAAASAEIEECLQNASSPDAVKRCLQRLKKILGLHGELSGEEGGGGGGEEEEEEETPKESKGKKPEMAAVVRECVAAKFDPKGHDLIALSGMSDPADRKTYIEARLAESRPAERVTSAGRRPGSGAAGKTPTQEQKTEPERLIPKW